MTTTYNPAEVERLVREAREDDERMGADSLGMANARWRASDHVLGMADQLEAARARIAELEGAIERMAPVVAAAEAYRDDGPCYAGIVPAVDAYRARIRGTE